MSWARPAQAALLGIALACAIDPSTTSCPARGCSAGLHVSTLASAGMALLSGLAVLAAVWRSAAAVRGLARALGRLPTVRLAELDDLVADLGLGVPVSVIESDDVMALCAGLLRPRIYVARALACTLGGAELRAVLLHEASHARRRDPLRRCLRSGLAEAFFFLPLARWWAERAAILDELAADRHALTVCGPGPLARALLVTGGSPLAPAAAFDGAGSIRVRHLLGEALHLPRPARRVCSVSVAGAVALGVSLVCLAGTVAGVVR